MKLALAILCAFLVLAKARNIQLDVEDLSEYDYLPWHGLPLVEDVRKAEEDRSRISGGQPSALGEIPYQAGIIIRWPYGDAVCGGSLISNRRVVTAAHCWVNVGIQANSLIIVLGSLTVFAGGTRITTTDVVPHSQWSPDLIRNDIAVAKLPVEVIFSNAIAPIALPSGSQLSESFAGDVATASGYGLTGPGSSITATSFLSHVDVDVITNAECISLFGTLVQDSNVCSSGAEGKGTCTSDSGGPLAVQRNGRPLLIGVTSFGAATCGSGFPGAFARITSYIDFINQNL